MLLRWIDLPMNRRADLGPGFAEIIVFSCTLSAKKAP